MMDTRISFADTTKGYREQYPKKLIDVSSPLVDPDGDPYLISSVRELFNAREIGDGTRFDLDGQLVHDGIRYSCDSITASYRFHTKFKLLDDLKGDPDFEKRVRDFIWNTYTIGGETLFPVNFCKDDPRYTGRNTSINQGRGGHKNVEDRLDITLECIRRFYSDRNDHSYPMEYTFHLGPQVEFFDIFGDFDTFVSFFFLDDLVEDGKVRLFIPWDGKHPFPKSVDEYYIFLDEQEEFVRSRNERIENYLRER